MHSKPRTYRFPSSNPCLDSIEVTRGPTFKESKLPRHQWSGEYDIFTLKFRDARAIDVVDMALACTFEGRGISTLVDTGNKTIKFTAKDCVPQEILMLLGANNIGATAYSARITGPDDLEEKIDALRQANHIPLISDAEKKAAYLAIGMSVTVSHAAPKGRRP